MNKFIIIFIVIALLFLSYLFFSSTRQTDNNSKPSPAVVVNTNNSVDYTNITDRELTQMLGRKDFKLVDVHTPEQKHIVGTDYVIPYNQVAEFIKTLPDKNEKIVLYCRSGGMSQALARELIKRGYKNIFSLIGGENGWVAGGGAVLPVGSIK